MSGTLRGVLDDRRKPGVERFAALAGDLAIDRFGDEAVADLQVRPRRAEQAALEHRPDVRPEGACGQRPTGHRQQLEAGPVVVAEERELSGDRAAQGRGRLAMDGELLDQQRVPASRLDDALQPLRGQVRPEP
jgi:hypothetical protein